jgi:hypothetical protein
MELSVRTSAKWLWIAVPILILASTLIADNYSENFESIKVGTKTVILPSGTITGGLVARGAFQGILPSALQYASWSPAYSYLAGCPGCQGTMTLAFDNPVDNFTFTFLEPTSVWGAVVSDDLGHTLGYGLVAPAMSKRIQWPWNGIKRLQIDGVLPIVSLWYFGIDDITYISSPPLAIVARLGDNPDATNPPTPVGVTNNMAVHIPLGRVASIRLKAKNTNGTFRDVPASFAFGHGTVQDVQTPEESLYPTDPLFLYSTAPNSATRLLQSLHVGSAPLIITPTDPKIPKVTLTVDSDNPYQLGETRSSNNTAWDFVFWGQASIRGIPPQYLKAVAYHESSFQPYCWRYEPKADRDYVRPERAVSPTADYRLPSPSADSGYALGQWICPGSLNPSCGFQGFVNPYYRPVPISDTLAITVLHYNRAGVDNVFPYDPSTPNQRFVTIREICNGNNGRTGWPCPSSPPPPPPGPPAPRPHPSVPPPDPWDSVANPHMAASYGMMQTTWYSLMDQGFWAGAPPEIGSGLRRNPSLLFDTPDNIARGSASLVLGPNELRWAFRNANPNSGVDILNSPFQGPSDFRSAMHNALRKYNGGGPATEQYANEVDLLVPGYEAIFGPGVKILDDGCSTVPVIADIADTTVVAGGTATVFAAVDGATNYQWYVGSTADTTQPIPDSNSPWVAVSPSSTTNYWVNASNTCGSAVAQATVTLVPECLLPTFSDVTADATVAPGTSVPLSVAVANATSYQWYEAPSGQEATAITNATSPQLTVTPMITTAYILKAASSCQSVAAPPITVTVQKTTPILTWPTPTTITYGTPLGAAQLSATSNVPGAFTYAPSAGSVLNIGTQALSASFTPTDSTKYTSANKTVTLVIQKAAPAITWTPVSLTYGTALGSGQLNAASNTAGSFTYSPAAATILDAGSQTLGVSFVPSDTANYAGSSASATITVAKAAQTISWATPAPITYGTPLSATQLNSTSNIPGTIVYDPPAGTILTAGTRTLTATFTPNDTANYNTVSGTVSLTVLKAAPTVTWSAPSNITYGTTLGATQLNASASVAGTFTYSPAAGTVLNTGTQTLTASFTPTDSANYNTASGTVSMTVVKATPTITWSTPSSITYGTALGATQLNASSSVAGTFTYSPAAGTFLTVGTQTLTTSFTPTDSANYNTASGTVSITVVKATPTITWSTPSSITYGTALGATQLNASSSVAGTFTYSPAAGTFLGGGDSTLSVSFSPTNSANYNTASATVTQHVNRAAQTITWATPATITNATPLSATQLNATVSVVGPAAAGAITYDVSSGTVLSAGDHTITATAAATANYDSAQRSVVLHVCGLATINSQTPNTTMSDGQSTTLSVSVSSTSTVHYQWYDGTTNVNGTPVGTDSASFNTGVLSTGGGPFSTIYRYWVVVTNDCGQLRGSYIDVTVVPGGMDDGG